MVREASLNLLGLTSIWLFETMLFFPFQISLVPKCHYSNLSTVLQWLLKSSRHRIMLWTFKISQKCVKRLFNPVRKTKKIKRIKQQQRLLRWKTRRGYSNPAWHLSPTFWWVLQHLIQLIATSDYLHSITLVNQLKINLSTLYENSYFKTFPVGGLR